MKDGPTDSRTDPKWPELLHVCAHEVRAPVTPLTGFLRMLRNGFAGPLSDHQRQCLEGAEKACVSLSDVLAELSELAQLEGGEAIFNRGTVNLKSILGDAVATLPELPGHPVTVALIGASHVQVHADAVKLKSAFTSILVALRRELVTSDQMVVRVDARDEGPLGSLRITVGQPEQIGELLQLEPPALVAFDEWRGGNGLRLPNARRIIEAHGGRVWERVSEPVDVGQKRGNTTAVITLPASR